MCQTRILSQSDSLVISLCQRCKLIYLWHGNLLLSLSERRFRELLATVQSVHFDQCSIPFPDGELRAIIATPGTEVNMVLSHQDLMHFKSMLLEASYMLEVYALMA